MNAGITWQSSADVATEVERPMPGPPRPADFDTAATPPRSRAAISSFEPKANGNGNGTTPPVRKTERREPPVTIEDPDEDPLTSGATIRFTRPASEVVQLLPGRLEVLSGEPNHQEIRFVRVQGKPPQLILGRNPGRSPQHVALRSSTVSRQHARLAFSAGRWAVANLSETNPVVVNDVELANTDAARPLSDGDRIELGEVVLRFRAH
jgi:pSer/pThr/pTyr-binding forkhead associated (FHA) protein